MQGALKTLPHFQKGNKLEKKHKNLWDLNGLGLGLKLPDFLTNNTLIKKDFCEISRSCKRRDLSKVSEKQFLRTFL